jgi:hypothetical protein
MVADDQGNSYRTEPQSIRLLDAPPLPPFPIQLAGNPVRLLWPAVTGHSYEVWSADLVTNAFELRATLTTTNTGWSQWIEPQTNMVQRFYRVRGLP